MFIPSGFAARLVLRMQMSSDLADCLLAGVIKGRY